MAAEGHCSGRIWTTGKIATTLLVAVDFPLACGSGSEFPKLATTVRLGPRGRRTYAGKGAGCACGAHNPERSVQFRHPLPVIRGLRSARSLGEKRLPTGRPLSPSPALCREHRLKGSCVYHRLYAATWRPTREPHTFPVSVRLRAQRLTTSGLGSTVHTGRPFENDVVEVLWV